MTPGREFVIEHADKNKKIIDLFQKLVIEMKFKESVKNLVVNLQYMVKVKQM